MRSHRGRSTRPWSKPCAPRRRATHTRNIPLHRYGTTDEIAAAAALLASGKAAYLTRRCLPVDGGFTATLAIFDPDRR